MPPREETKGKESTKWHSVERIPPPCWTLEQFTFCIPPVGPIWSRTSSKISRGNVTPMFPKPWVYTVHCTCLLKNNWSVTCYGSHIGLKKNIKCFLWNRLINRCVTSHLWMHFPRATTNPISVHIEREQWWHINHNDLRPALHKFHTILMIKLINGPQDTLVVKFVSSHATVVIRANKGETWNLLLVQIQHIRWRLTF